MRHWGQTVLRWVRSPGPVRRRLAERRRGLVRLVDVAVVLVVAAVVGAVVVQLTGFGSSARMISEAGRRTVEAGTAQIEVVTVTDGGVGGQKQRVDTTGLVDLGTGAAEYEVVLGVPQATPGMPTTRGGVGFVVASDGAQSWARMASGPADQLWTRLPDDGEPQPGAGGDLATQFAVFAESMTGIEHLGEEPVRGVDTDHYRLSLDPDVLLDGSGTDAAALPSGFESAVREQSVDVDVWIGDGLVRRLSYQLPIGVSSDSDLPEVGTGLGAGATITHVTEYFDFGVAFSPALPDEDERDQDQPDQEERDDPSPEPTVGDSTSGEPVPADPEGSGD